jgi:hypothetical protein
MKMTAFGDVVPCSPVEIYRRFGDVCMYVFIYCKCAQVRWQNYIDISNIQIKIKHQQ